MKSIKKGFTVIELLVVIAIITLLGTIVLVAIKGARERALDVVEQHNLDQLRTALESWYQSEGDGKYIWAKDQETGPVNWQSWQDTPCYAICSVPNTGCGDYSNSTSDKFMAQLVEKGYFSRGGINQMIGVNPQNSKLQIRYYYTCDLQSYRLTARLSDGSCYKVGKPVSGEDCPPLGN